VQDTISGICHYCTLAASLLLAHGQSRVIVAGGGGSTPAFWPTPGPSFHVQIYSGGQRQPPVQFTSNPFPYKPHNVHSVYNLCREVLRFVVFVGVSVC